MTPQAAHSLFTEEAFADLRAHPAFRQACEHAAAGAVDSFVALAPPFQWITKDLGRAAICMTALILHNLGGLTVQNLTASVVANGISSAGRVNQVVRRCQEIGQIEIEDGPGIWTRRPARLGAEVIQLLHDRAMVDLRAAVRLRPELEPAMRILETPEGFVSFVVSLSVASRLRRDLFDFGQCQPISFFLQREAGMAILFELLALQPTERSRLMEWAPLSRYALARRYGVSRAHINKMLAESGHTHADGDRVEFSQELSDAMERHFTVVFRLNHVTCEALLAGWRYRPEGVPGSHLYAASAA